ATLLVTLFLFVVFVLLIAFGLLITLIRLVFIGFIVLIAISFSLAILITTLLVSSALVAVAIIIAPVSFILFGSLCVTLGLFTRALLIITRSEEHTSELQSRFDLVCRLLLEKKKTPRQRRTGCEQRRPHS